MIILLLELLLSAWILKALLLHLLSLLCLFRRFWLFGLVQFAQILPIFEISVNKLRIFSNQFFEAGLRQLLIVEVVGINVRLQKQATWSVHFLLETIQHGNVLLSCCLEAGCVFSGVWGQTLVYQFYDLLYKSILVQELLQHFQLLNALVRQIEFLIFCLLPEMNGFERHV